MNRFERRRLKKNIYKHGNAIMYTVIFVMASIITLVAATNRTDDIAFIDESKMVAAENESVAVTNSTTQKVAIAETVTEVATNDETLTEPTVDYEAEGTTQQNTVDKVKITADTLNVRATASIEGEMLGMVAQDQIFDVISVSGEWIEINYNGSAGYINSEFTEIVE